MTNHHLSMEQRFHLEAAFREIDTCEDIEKLRELTKIIRLRRTKRRLRVKPWNRSERRWKRQQPSDSDLSEITPSTRGDWLDKISAEWHLEWWTL